MIQSNKKYAFTVCMFSLLFAFSAAQAHTLSPAMQKVFGYTEKSVGILCTIGASVVACHAFNDFSVAELSRASSQGAGDAIGVLAGYAKKLVLPIVLLAGGFYLMERGEQDLQQAEINECRVNVQKKLDEWTKAIWPQKKECAQR